MSVSTSVPPTRREDVVDTYHGIAVADPYRWLEDGDDPEVAAWVAAQNELTRSLLDVPVRSTWHRATRRADGAARRAARHAAR